MQAFLYYLGYFSSSRMPHIRTQVQHHAFSTCQATERTGMPGLLKEGRKESRSQKRFVILSVVHVLDVFQFDKGQLVGRHVKRCHLVAVFKRYVRSIDDEKSEHGRKNFILEG